MTYEHGQPAATSSMIRRQFVTPRRYGCCMIDQGAGLHTCARPKPVWRDRRTDLVFVRPRPITTVAVGIAEGPSSSHQYFAASAERTWSGTVEASTPDSAIVDAILAIRAESPDLGLARFVPQVTARSPVWRHRAEISAAIPDTSLERPDSRDQALMRVVTRALSVDLNSVNPAPVADGSPVTVATDGSVRGKITGYGWLASTGEYNLAGFRHCRKQIGDFVVLVSELRAIGDAVRRLRGRHITLISDCRPAVDMTRQWMAGFDVLPQGYTIFRENGKEPGLVTARRLIRECHDQLDVSWAPGHCGEPLNEGADALARLASRYAKGNSGLFPDEYRCRAAGLANAFSNEFNRARSLSMVQR